MERVADAGGKRPMTFWDHFEELRRRIKPIVVVFLILWVIFMTFSMSAIAVSGMEIPILVPAYGSDSRAMANQFFMILVDHLKPSYVQLAAKTPWDGALAQFEVAGFLAFVGTIPVSSYEFARFVGPGLKPAEKRIMLRMVPPIVLLFLFGVLLDYYLLLPFTINFLYGMQRGMGVTLYVLFLGDFISFVTIHLIAFGVAFQLPVIMYTLSAVNIVPADFWKRNWRYITAGIFVVAALITPDPSGITMVVVGVVMMGLYAIGYAFARYAERPIVRAKSSYPVDAGHL